MPSKEGRNEGRVYSSLLEKNGHLLLVERAGGIPRACLIKKVTHVITAFHPKKPRTDISVLPGEKEEGAYFPSIILLTQCP